MAGSVNFSNHQWLAKSFDTNNNNVMDELKVDPRVQAKIDSDGNGQISRQELVSALQADTVEVKQGVISESKGSAIFVHGLETLKNVHSTATRSWGHVFTSSTSADDTPEVRFSKLTDSNRAYSSAISSQESALRSVKDMTSGATDATSKALNIQAKTALNSATWRTWTGTFQDILNNGSATDYNLQQMQMANTNFQAAYETLNNTLRSIAEQTKDLPDVQGAINATDSGIANAFSNIQAIESNSQSPQQVHGKLNVMADQVQASSGGRAGLWGGIGAGVGVVGGAAVGYFAGGHSIKNAGVGAAAGAALLGGGGALVGHLKDKSLLGEAKSLRDLANDVTSYNPAAAKTSLTSETQNLYNEILDSRDTHDLDNARVNTNDLNAIKGRVTPIQNESARILGAYKK